jgi:hypothetical protein
MEMVYSLDFFLMLAFAAAWYKAADVEKAPPLLWSGLSVAISLLAWRVFGWGWIGCIMSQIGLLAGITLFKVLKDLKKEPPDAQR